MNDPRHIAARLVAISRERGFTQKRISEISGIPEKTISLIFTGKTVPGFGTLCRIADAVEVKISFT